MNHNGTAKQSKSVRGGPGDFIATAIGLLTDLRWGWALTLPIKLTPAPGLIGVEATFVEIRRSKVVVPDAQMRKALVTFDVPMEALNGERITVLQMIDHVLKSTLEPVEAAAGRFNVEELP